jgi:hypothetical protein
MGKRDAGPPQYAKRHSMEAERTNTIRTQLDDLTTRVVELRRYL